MKLKSRCGGINLEYILIALLVGVLILGAIFSFGFVLKKSIEVNTIKVQQETYDELCRAVKKNDSSIWNDNVSFPDGEWDESECS